MKRRTSVVISLILTIIMVFSLSVSSSYALIYNRGIVSKYLKSIQERYYNNSKDNNQNENPEVVSEEEQEQETEQQDIEESAEEVNPDESTELEENKEEAVEEQKNDEAVETTPSIPRPIWVISHRCNNSGDIWRSCNQGANAVEIDIRRRKNGTWVLNHDGAYFPSISLERFFKEASVESRLCLVILDIKDPVKMGELNKRIHEYMDKYGCNNIRVIYSVSTIEKGRKYFPQISNSLRYNEGLCIDYESNAQGVNNLFASLGVENCWYGHGIASRYLEWAIRLYPGLTEGMKLRDGDGVIKKVENWTLNDKDIIEERIIDMNVDAIIVEGGGGDFHLGYCGIYNTMRVINEHPDKVYIATRADNPFVKFTHYTN